MRFNKEQMVVLATAGATYDKEGALFFQEKQEGFFRKNESTSSLSLYWIFCKVDINFSSFVSI